MNTKIGQRPLNLAIVLATVLGLTALTIPAYATNTAANLTVSADINASCTMNVTDLNFGAYDPIVANATEGLTGSATVSATCTSGATGVVTMSGGLHPTFCMSSKCYRRTIRNMANEGSTSYLRYEIYADASHTIVWNYSQVSMSSVASVTGTGASQDMTVYGKVFKNQKDAAAGSYADTVTIGVNY
jgi:spore coat protein U-like protein